MVVPFGSFLVELGFAHTAELNAATRAKEASRQAGVLLMGGSLADREGYRTAEVEVPINVRIWYRLSAMR